MIRQMCEADADAVREVDALAFWEWARQEWGDGVPMHRRTHRNVLACLGMDPEGCFVAEEQGKVVGYIFSRTWGGVGWFGTFAVLPDRQGSGIGRQLIAHSLQYLRRDGELVVGLETMPQSPSNLGLYLRVGFEARFPTLVMSKPVQRHDVHHRNVLPWSSAREGTRRRWLADLQGAWDRILPTLDYSREISSCARHGIGETLVLTREGRAVGMAVVRFASNHEGLEQPHGSIEIAALRPEHTDERTLGQLMGATEGLALARAKDRVTLAVNGCHAWAVAQLLRRGYRVDRMAVRMVLRGTDDGPVTDDMVDLGRWAG